MDRRRVGKRRFFDWRYVTFERRRAYTWACILFWSILMYFFFRQYVVSVGIVTDRSMLPTLQQEGYFLINKYIYHVSRPHRGDIVVLRQYHYAPDYYVKRVIGLSGEMLRITGGSVYINGQRLVEPYAVGKTFPDVGPLVIEKDTYFVMGDNRSDSQDSRHFGAVPLKNIDGKIKPGELFPFR